MVIIAITVIIVIIKTWKLYIIYRTSASKILPAMYDKI